MAKQQDTETLTIIPPGVAVRIGPNAEIEARVAQVSIEANLKVMYQVVCGLAMNVAANGCSLQRLLSVTMLDCESVLAFHLLMTVWPDSPAHMRRA